MKRRNKSELARDLKVFAKVQTKLHNRSRQYLLFIVSFESFRDLCIYA